MFEYSSLQMDWLWSSSATKWGSFSLTWSLCVILNSKRWYFVSVGCYNDVVDMCVACVQIIQTELEVFGEFSQQFVQLANGSEPGRCVCVQVQVQVQIQVSL